MSGAQAQHDNHASASASSSTRSPVGLTPPSTDDHDELDFLGQDDEDDNLQDIDFGSRRQSHPLGRASTDSDVLDDDPIHGDLGTSSLSFKRRQKPSLMSAPGRFFSSLTGGSNGSSSSAGRAEGSRSGTPLNRHQQSSSWSTAIPPDAKDAQAHDWYTEGPGRRVGYEDLTAIDWIFEYTKERQRIRVLRSTTSGLLGYAQHLLDASQVWIILLLTGITVGAIAAAINIASDWLSDLKLGFCSGGPEGGQFHLNRSFCCYGYDTAEECSGWKTWGQAFGITAVSGRWTIEYIFYLAIAVTLAYFASVLVQEYAIYAKHSGIPEIKTILGGFVIRRLLGGWTLLTKSLGLVLAVSSGMWLGKEGPLVHVACCCANIFIKLFGTINDNEARKREVLSAAAASGISVAFGSPIGGVLFSLESLSYYFPDKTMWQSFVCAMAAAVVLQAFDPFRSGKLVMYQTKYSVDWHGFELIPYAILGILGGVYGGLFIRANMFVARWKKNRPWLPSPIKQVIAVALLTALINYPNFYMKVQSTELVSNLFVECAQVHDDPIGLCKTGAASANTIVLLLFAAVLGFFLAVITFGLQIPAGIILPSMAIGALIGRSVGIIVELMVQSAPGFFLFQTCKPDVPCITPGTYAIIGAAAALAGVTRLTVSIVVIMFELTGALTYVLPIMVAVMISKWVGDAFSRRGIYESWIHFNEYPFIDNSDEMIIPDAPVSQIMTRIEDLVVLTATGHTIASLETILEANPYRGFPVISDPRDAIFLGYISRAELTYNIRAATAPPRSLPPETETFFSHQPLADPRTTLDLRPWMDQTPLTLPSRTTLHLVVSYFQKLGLRYILFSDRGVLQGLLTKKDVWYVLNGSDETRRTESAPASGRVSGVERGGGREEEERGLLGRRGAGEDEEDDDRDRGSIL